MFEQLGFDTLSAKEVSAFVGLVLGALFGFVAQRSRFCLRRGLVETNTNERLRALAVWLGALAVAMLVTQLFRATGLLDFSEHRFHAAEISVLAIVLGGLLFGVGMVLTRGCVSRLCVLTGTGNLRALLVVLLFVITAHATLKGVITPLRTAVNSVTLDVSTLTIPAWGGVAVALLIFLLVWLFFWKTGVSAWLVAGSIVIGLLVPIAWLATGYVLLDEFDPIIFESISFTASGTDWLFWTVAGTSIGAGFGVGFFTGVIVGSAIAALLWREFQWISFESPRQTGRYLLGAVSMGVGGVLAGGCTVGAGLGGVSTFSFSAMVALLSIVVGGLSAKFALGARAV